MTRAWRGMLSDAKHSYFLLASVLKLLLLHGIEPQKKKKMKVCYMVGLIMTIEKARDHLSVSRDVLNLMSCLSSTSSWLWSSMTSYINVHNNMDLVGVEGVHIVSLRYSILSGLVHMMCEVEFLLQHVSKTSFGNKCFGPRLWFR